MLKGKVYILPFYETWDGFVTAPKIPVKTSLKQLAKSKMFFLHYLNATVICKTYLDKKIYEIYALNRSVQIFVTRT